MKIDCRDCNGCEHLSEGRCRACDGTERRGRWYEDDFTKIKKCSLCCNDAPISTVSGEQYEAKYCPSCGAEMDGEEEPQK